MNPYLLFLFTIPVIIFTLYSCATMPWFPTEVKNNDSSSFVLNSTHIDTHVIILKHPAIIIPFYNKYHKVQD